MRSTVTPLTHEAAPACPICKGRCAYPCGPFAPFLKEQVHMDAMLLLSGRLEHRAVVCCRDDAAVVELLRRVLCLRGERAVEARLVVQDDERVLAFEIERRHGLPLHEIWAMKIVDDEPLKRLLAHAGVAGAL
jgi:hypothetical protein